MHTVPGLLRQMREDLDVVIERDPSISTRREGSCTPRCPPCGPTASPTACTAAAAA